MANSIKLMSQESRQDIYVILCFLTICIFQSFALFQPDSTLNPVPFKGTFVALSFFIAVSAFLCSPKSFKITSEGLLFTVSIIVFWFLELIHSYGKLTFLSSTVYLVFIPFLFLKKNFQERVYASFEKVFWGVSLVGIIVFIVYILNIIPPPSIVDYYEEDMITSNYANYYLSYLFVTDYGLTRLCGLFNEPGFFGTLAILLLVSNRMKINKYTIVILVASFFTFSLAFFALLLIYFLVKSITYRQFKFLLIFLLIVAGILYLSSIELEDSNLSFLLQRLFPEDGGLFSDNRTTNDMEKSWKIFIDNTDKLWFGYGPFLDVRGSSYKVLVMKHGLLGMLLIFMPFLIACFKLSGKNRDCWIFVIVFIVSIYQRPQIFNLAYFVILIGGILHLRNSSIPVKRKTSE